MVAVQHIHPMLVHFPIVLIILLAAIELVAVSLGRDVSGRTPVGNLATGMVVIAALAAVAAYYFGDYALSFAEASGFESDVAEVHESLGKLVAVAASVWALVRIVLWFRDVKVEQPLAFIFPAVSIVGAGLIVWTAYYGGLLVFDLGVNVSKAALSG